MTLARAGARALGDLATDCRITLDHTVSLTTLLSGSSWCAPERHWHAGNPGRAEPRLSASAHTMPNDVIALQRTPVGAPLRVVHRTPARQASTITPTRASHRRRTPVLAPPDGVKKRASTPGGARRRNHGGNRVPTSESMDAAVSATRAAAIIVRGKKAAEDEKAGARFLTAQERVCFSLA